MCITYFKWLTFAPACFGATELGDRQRPSEMGVPQPSLTSCVPRILPIVRHSGREPLPVREPAAHDSLVEGVVCCSRSKAVAFCCSWFTREGVGFVRFELSLVGMGRKEVLAGVHLHWLLLPEVVL